MSPEQNSLEQLLANLNYYLKVLFDKKELISTLERSNRRYYEQLSKLDLRLILLEKELEQKSKQIDVNIASANIRSFFEFADTANEGTANLGVGSRDAGNLTAVKVLSTSEITSLDDTPSAYTEVDSIITASSTDIGFQPLFDWKAFEITTLDLSGVTGSGTRVDLAGEDLNNKFYLINMGEDTAVRIHLVLGTTMDGVRSGYYIYAGEADTSDPSVKFIRSTAASSIPSWNYDVAYHYMNLDNALVVRYDSSLGAFIKEAEYTR